MKIMHFHFGKDGGAERFFVHLVNAFSRRGAQQRAIIRPGRPWRGEIAAVADLRESHFRRTSLSRFLLPMHVRRVTRQWEPDALMAWMPRASQLMPRYQGAVRVARLGDYPTDLSPFNNVDVLVCNTPLIADHVRSLGWRRSVRVISNFTNTETVAPVDRGSLDTPVDAPLVCAVGRFVPRKGLDVVVSAVARLPETYLWLVGDGQQEPQLRAMVRELGIEHRVRFVGWRSDPRPYLAASDVFAAASRHEPLGNVILEAWAQRIPVVSTRSEGPSWFMRDGVNGVLVDVDDAEALSHALHRVLADRPCAQRLVDGASATLADQFSEEAVAAAYFDLFGGGTQRIHEDGFRSRAA